MREPRIDIRALQAQFDRRIPNALMQPKIGDPQKAWRLSFAGLALSLALLYFWQVAPSTEAADAGKLKPSGETVKKELTAVVESQLAAFRVDDYKTAYTFAATAIKDQFPLSAFEQMVKKGYPAIAQSQSASFGVVLDDGEQAVVNVIVKGKSGKTVRYQYMLGREGKSWKINGVQEQAPSGDEV